jgi:hypothetical protein
MRATRGGRSFRMTFHAALIRSSATWRYAGLDKRLLHATVYGQHRDSATDYRTPVVIASINATDPNARA